MFDNDLIYIYENRATERKTAKQEDGDLSTLLAKKVVTPPLKTIKPMWIELLCFHLAEIGMIWTRDCSPTKSDTTLGRHSMQGQVGSSSSETTV